MVSQKDQAVRNNSCSEPSKDADSGIESSLSLPAWARESSFPKSLDGWGWLGVKGQPHQVESEQALVAAIREDKRADVSLVWTPEHEFMVLPEELDAAGEAIFSSRQMRAVADRKSSQVKCLGMGLLLAAYAVYLFVADSPDGTLAEKIMRGIILVGSSIVMGVGLLVFLILAFIPWYQSGKRLRDLEHWTDGHMAALIPVLRFETWLDLQKAHVTKWLMGLVCLVGAAQLLPGNSILAAGLVKPAYAQGEWWRLLTYSMLHGNLIHFLMNGAALLYLGKRVEVFAKWPHLLTVFVFSSLVGGEFSARLLDAPTVGASGGLMGWLGFLLVLESLHQRLVPRDARRRLLAGVILTAVIGLIGYRFIDNAVHAGGLLAGMLYAIIVFMKSTSNERPRITRVDLFAGALGGAAIMMAALIAVIVIL